MQRNETNSGQEPSETRLIMDNIQPKQDQTLTRSNSNEPRS